MIVEGSANAIGILLLLAWIPFTILAFVMLRPPAATLTSVMGGTLFLAVGIGFDAPGIPPLGKYALPSLLCVLCAAYWAPRRLFSMPRPGVAEACLALLLGVSIVTPLGNSDTLVYGPTILAPMTFYDSLSFLIRNLLFFGAPFWLGRTLFRDSDDLAMLLRFLVAAGLGYSILIAFEVRFSPQLHRWLFGFHQMDFAMTLRFGGYRPMVFMRSGIEVAMFVLASLIASATLARGRMSLARIPTRWIPFYLGVILFLCKSLGAIIYGVLLAPLLAVLRPRGQCAIAALLALFVFTYPILRTAGLLPVQEAVEFFAPIDPDRARSLEGRFDNEEALVAKARERPWFGWGSFGRNRIYDSRSGRDLSVTDGFWVIQLGTTGVLGYAAVFGMLLAPIFSARRRVLRSDDPRERRLLAGLAMIVAVTTLDLLPNGFVSSLHLLMAGALYGATRSAPLQAARPAPEEQFAPLEALPELPEPPPGPVPTKAPPGLRF